MSIYINKFDPTGDMGKRGANAENIFVKLFKGKFRVEPSSDSDQIKKHIDYYVYNKDNRYFTVDVKSRKKFTDDDEFVWIEFKNVNGSKGWLYGSSNVIAFERKEDFIIVNRKKLLSLCESLVSLDKTANRNDCVYKAYTREGRKDLISKISFKDIFDNIDYTKISKK